jgi:predicted ATPase/class 3 adenylate cyclase
MRCPGCDFENAAGKRFCIRCGVAFGARCPKCGSENPPEASYCGDCGAVLSQPTANPRSAERGAAPTIVEHSELREIPEGERRHLTVLFCDLVGSTEIAGHLDPEQWREIVGEYHQAAAQAIERFGGHVAQYLGDGVMAYYGWPEAHDNDAERAARSGLAILEAITKLNEQPARPKLAARVGIDSGAVVVGAGAGKEADVFGDTPNIAARVQAAAAPGTVLISADAHRLVSGLFVVEDCGAQTLTGIERPVQLYRVVQPSGVRGRLEAAAAARGLTPFVGREDELRLLMNRWERALDSEGQVALIVGEAGIGKSRLVQRFHEQIAGTSHTWVEAAAGPFFQNTPFYPVAEMLRELLSWRGNESAEEQLTELEARLALAGLKPAEVLPLIAPLLNLPITAEYPPSSLSPEQQRRRLLAALVEWVLGHARVQPLIIAIEDLHWADPSTLELIQLLVEQAATERLLLLYTARPEFRPQWPPRAHYAQITLDRLSSRNARRMVEQAAAEKVLSEETIATVVERTGGVPLFVEELTRVVLESGSSKPSGREIPVTLYDSLMARLDRLGPAKEVIQVGAVIGGEFSYELLHAVHTMAEEDLQSVLRSLANAELLYVRGIPPKASYSFKHALIRDAAYEALLKSTRQQYHERIAQVLKARFTEVADMEPELLARHYTEAHLFKEGVSYWQRAGERASARSAMAEATSHIHSGLELLATLPETPERAQQELTLHLILGPALIASKGWSASETEAAYKRAADLCQQVGNTPQLFPVLYGVCTVYAVRPELKQVRELALRLLSLARQHRNTDALVEGYFLLGYALFFMADLPAALEHLEQAIKLYGRDARGNLAVQYGHDPGMSSRFFAACTLWLLGYPKQARNRALETVSLARSINHPFTLAYAYGAGALALQLRRDTADVREQAAAGMTISQELGSPHFLGFAEAMWGWVLVEEGQITEGLKHLNQGAEGWRSQGSELWRPYWLALLAEAYGKAGRVSEGVATLTEAVNITERTGETFYLAELYRLKGEFALQQFKDEGSPLGVASPQQSIASCHAEAESCFYNAIELARRQQAKSLELRAAMSLTRLLAKQGRRDEARAMLAEIYGWFTEGFDTADLKDAKALLGELNG